MAAPCKRLPRRRFASEPGTASVLVGGSVAAVGGQGKAGDTYSLPASRLPNFWCSKHPNSARDAAVRRRRHRLGVGGCHPQVRGAPLPLCGGDTALLGDASVRAQQFLDGCDWFLNINRRPEPACAASAGRVPSENWRDPPGTLAGPFRTLQLRGN